MGEEVKPKEVTGGANTDVGRTRERNRKVYRLKGAYLSRRSDRRLAEAGLKIGETLVR